MNNLSYTSSISPLNGFMRLPQILKLYPIGRSTWWAGVKAGRFPQPVKLGARITAWRTADIHSLLEAIHAANQSQSQTEQA